MKKISVIVPCYNEKEVLLNLFRRLTDSACKWDLDWEVICVDDGSSDGTWGMLLEQNKKDSRWKAISFSRNFGHQTAVSCGISYAAGDAVIIIDADLQDPPEELQRLITKWQEGYDVVYAIRRDRKEGVFKKISYWLFYRLMAKLLAFDFPLDSGDFSLMDRRVVDIIKHMPERNRFVRGLRAWVGFSQIGVEYQRHERTCGKPKYTFRKLLKLSLDGIVSFSFFPLTLASYVGFFISLIALLGALFTLIQRIFKEFFAKIGLEPVPGYTTIVISLLFIGGIQLIFLGIIGQYLGRIYDEVKRRPLWLVKDVVGIDSKIPN